MITTVRVSWFKSSENLGRFLYKFFFEPASAQPLSALRIGLSTVLLGQAFLMHGSFHSFFASTGFVQKEVTHHLSNSSLPRLNWAIELYSRLGFGENAALTSLGFIYVLSLVSLLFGLFTRPSAFIAWFLNWSFLNTGYSGAYGVDTYAHIFLFYLIFVPAGEAYSVDCLLKRSSGEPSYEARLGLRVLQLHMCISYLASGIEKASGEQWWNGEVLWIALNAPGYSVMDLHWLANTPLLPMMAGWFVLVIEIFYCVFIWPKETRTFWIAAICLLHLGIAIFLRLHIFGLLMCIPTVALFAFPSAPHAGVARHSRGTGTFFRS